MDTVDYSKQETPANYSCCQCGKTGVKLWREYQSFGSIPLLCVDCASAIKGIDPKSVKPDGSRKCEDGMKTDTIGWFVPAVPMAGEKGAYWGYTSVPDDGINWWKNLPINITTV